MPSFAIEAPAEANPLTLENLYNVLRSSSSSDQHQVQTGTKQLQNWETLPGFYSSLQTLFIDTSLPVEVRYLSIIQLKNGLTKYWRRTATNVITKEEKKLIRSRSVESTVNEPDSRLALQGAVIVSKIIRAEYPRDWPDALSSVFDVLKYTWNNSPETRRLSRLLLVSLYVIKELSAVRIATPRTSLRAEAPRITDTLFTIYTSRADKWMNFLEFGSDDEGGALVSMEQSLLTLRILRRLILQYDYPNRYDHLQKLWSKLTAHFSRMFQMISNPDQQLQLQLEPRHLIEKHIFQMAKLHLTMCRTHPAAFVLLPGSIDAVGSYWQVVDEFSRFYGIQSLDAKDIGTDGDNDDKDDIPFMELLSLKGLLIVRACLKMIYDPVRSFVYSQREDKEERDLSREMIMTKLLTLPFKSEAMITLVSQCFVFTLRDLRQWETEPDEWEKSQEGAGDDWEFSFRICSEKLFLDLLIHNKDQLRETFVEYVLKTIQILDYGNNISSVFRKDSIYAAVGLAAPVLENVFDFSGFLDRTLAQEVQVRKPGYNIIRRRIAIVLGQWLPVKEGLNRGLAYQIFQHLLSKDDPLNDQVVRVTAGRQLHNIIDPFEFIAKDFVPYAPATLDSLMVLIQEVELPETKLALLTTLSLIVSKMEQLIIPFADQVISLLPPLWEQAGEDYLMKQNILGILTALVTSMQEDSQKYHSLIIPLIQSSVEPTSETRPFLLEDALDLWAAIIEQTPSPASPEIVGLVQYLPPMYEVASEALRKALEITEAYIYLIPSDILSNVALLLQPFASLLGTVKREASGIVTHLVELMIRQADELEGLKGVQNLTSALLSTSFLPFLLNTLHDAHTAHQSSGPNRETSPIDDVVETNYLSVLARLAVVDPSLVVSALEAAMPTPPMEWLLTEWFTHIDSISSPVQKKLTCLALTNLITTGQPWILSRLQSLMTVWTDIINELVIDDVEPQTGREIKRDCLVYTDPETMRTPGFDSPAAGRHHILTFRDPIHREDIRDYVRERLNVVVSRNSMDAFRGQWLVNVDANVLSDFAKLGLF